MWHQLCHRSPPVGQGPTVEQHPALLQRFPSRMLSQEALLLLKRCRECSSALLRGAQGDCTPNQCSHVNLRRSRGVRSVPDPAWPCLGMGQQRTGLTVQKSLQHTQIFCFSTPHSSPQRASLVARRPRTDHSTQKLLQNRDGPRRQGAARLAAL